MQRKSKFNTITRILNIAAVTMIMCTLQQLYASGNDNNTGRGGNLGIATSSSSEEDVLSMMAVGDSIGYNIVRWVCVE